MDSKISQLPELSSLQGSEDIVLSVNGTTYRVRPSTLGNFLSSGNGHTHSVEAIDGLRTILDTIETNLALKATTADLQAQLQTIMGGVSPAVLDTIKEISDALQADQTVTQTLVDGLVTKADLTYVDVALAGKANNSHSHSKSEIGLGNVDNTSDADKPVSNAVALSLIGKANIDHSHTFTRSDVGLENVDNTSDLAKPISTATQTALDNKADVNHTHSLSKADVGLSNVDNTSDSDKPISILTQAALDTIQSLLAEKAASSHTHTATQIGLGSVDNTADLDKPISTATQTALDNKAGVQYVDSQLQLKANVDQLSAKADISYVDSAVADKVTNDAMMTALAATAPAMHSHSVTDITGLEQYIQTRIADSLLPKFDIIVTPGNEAFGLQIDFTRLNAFVLSNLAVKVEYKGIADDESLYINVPVDPLVDGTYSYINSYPMAGVGSAYEANVRVTLINTKDLDNKLVIKQVTLTTL